MGHRSLIKDKTQTAVINIVKLTMFITAVWILSLIKWSHFDKASPTFFFTFVKENSPHKNAMLYLRKRARKNQSKVCNCLIEVAVAPHLRGSCRWLCQFLDFLMFLGGDSAGVLGSIDASVSIEKFLN